MMYLATLRELSRRFDCTVHAYCLMTNHVHLLITPNTPAACAVLMKELGQRYVQYFNRTYERTGTLWEGRYRSCIAESARYVLACYRYIELNPVRAGMVDHPARFPWSSYSANTGHRFDPMVSPHPEFLALGSDSGTRHAAYQDLVDHGLDAAVLTDIREATNGGYPLGTDAFKARLSLPTGRKLERGRAGRPPQSQSDEDKSGSDPDLFSEDAVS